MLSQSICSLLFLAGLLNQCLVLRFLGCRRTTSLESIRLIDELFKFDRTVVRVFHTEQTLPRITQSARIGDSLSIRLVLVKAVPDIVQVPMNVQMRSRWNPVDGLMRQIDVAEDESIASKIEPILHPPRTVMMPVVISTDQNLATGQLGIDFLPTFSLTDEHVTDVDNQIGRLDDLLPVTNQHVREISGTVAVRGDLSVIKGACQKSEIFSCTYLLVVGTAMLHIAVSIMILG